VSQKEPSTERRQDSSGPPRVFVSYTHENPDHKRWVSQLATDLRSQGVDAILDQWDLQLGDDVTLFMERGIREAERVLLVCTPAYARKANEGQGGVGYERLVVTGELAAQIDTNKFICVLRSGTKEGSIPAFAQTRLFVDFTDDSTYAVSLKRLLRDIHNAPVTPKPPIGANPFKDASPPTASGTLLRGQRTSIAASCDTEELYARALHLLRDKDLAGWKQLVRNVRRAMPESLIAWRGYAERAMQERKKEWNEWYEILHKACQGASPIMLLALSAVDSEIEGLADQRGLLDDLINIPEWHPSGIKIVIQAPFVLAYVFHNVLGAFLVASSRHREAVRLLRTRVPISVGSSRVRELWQSSDMMGWTDALGGALVKGWEFLNSLWEKHPWLGHFFVRRDDFLISLRAYVLLAGLLELASCVSRNGVLLPGEGAWRGSVPPLFLLPISGNWDVPSTSKLVALAVPDRSAPEAVAEEYGCPVQQVRDSWPTFYRGWVRTFEQSPDLDFRSAAREHLEPPELP
jgi:hypothetical protein